MSVNIINFKNKKQYIYTYLLTLIIMQYIWKHLNIYSDGIHIDI